MEDVPERDEGPARGRSGGETAPVGGHVLMTCAGHHVEFRCCAVLHYRSVEPVLVGDRIRAENLRRLCAGCPEAIEGLRLRCCVCRQEPVHPWAVSSMGTLHPITHSGARVPASLAPGAARRASPSSS